MTNTPLTDKERKAVEEYIKNGQNKSKAIVDAGYETNHPDVMGSQVFSRPKVKQAVEAALKELGITPAKILQRFDRMATKGKNENAKVRANENLAQLADLYPDKDKDKDETGNITINLQY